MNKWSNIQTLFPPSLSSPMNWWSLCPRHLSPPLSLPHLRLPASSPSLWRCHWNMRRFADTQRALQAVERLQAKLKERGEVPTEEKLSLLKSVLQSPLFHQILALQKSVQHLRDQVNPKPFCLKVLYFLQFGSHFLCHVFLRLCVLRIEIIWCHRWLKTLSTYFKCNIYTLI